MGIDKKLTCRPTNPTVELTLKQSYTKRILAGITILSSTSLCASPLPAQANKHHHLEEGKVEHAKVSHEKREKKTWVTAKTVIKAPPKIVWETVHEERKKDPDLAYSKVLEQGVNECRLEQKFVLIPVIGAAVCEMHNSEIPGKRIDYKLLKSDRFKAMEGSWILTPTDDGKSTILELTTHLDLGLPVPKAMMNGATAKKLARRLDNVKKMAEQTHASVAQSELKQPQ